MRSTSEGGGAKGGSPGGKPGGGLLRSGRANWFCPGPGTELGGPGVSPGGSPPGGPAGPVQQNYYIYKLVYILYISRVLESQSKK